MAREVAASVAGAVNARARDAGGAEGRVVEVSDETFDTVALHPARPAVVNFSVPWCGPCLAMERLLDALAPEYVGRVVVAKLNAEHNPRLAERYNVRGLPTFILFRHGQEMTRLSGTPGKAQLRQLLDRALGAE